MRRDRRTLNKETRYKHSPPALCRIFGEGCVGIRQTQPRPVLQLTLRVKALKRQVDEGETELERLEGLRRKAQRDMEDQMELKEALQTRVAALETDLK